MGDEEKGNMGDVEKGNMGIPSEINQNKKILLHSYF